MPTCAHCSLDKPQDEFGKRGEKYRGVCRKCRSIQQLAWSRANPDKKKKYRSDYYTKKTGRSPEERRRILLTENDRIDRAVRKKENRKLDYQKNRQRYLDAAKLRNETHKEQISLYQKEWRSINSKKKKDEDAAWRAANPYKVALYSNTRRASKLNASPPWLDAIQKAQIQEMYDVAYILNIQTGVKHHVDHIHPLQGATFSGLHVPWNLQVIPKSENLSKGRKLPPEDSHMLWGNE